MSKDTEPEIFHFGFVFCTMVVVQNTEMLPDFSAAPKKSRFVLMWEEVPVRTLLSIQLLLRSQEFPMLFSHFAVLLQTGKTTWEIPSSDVGSVCCLFWEKKQNLIM